MFAKNVLIVRFFFDSDNLVHTTFLHTVFFCNIFKDNKIKIKHYLTNNINLVYLNVLRMLPTMC